MVVVTVVKMDPLIRQFMHDAVIIFIVMMHLIQLSAAAIMPWLPTTEETVYWTGSSFEVLKKYHTCLAKGIWSHELGQWGSGALLQQLLGISFVAYVVLKIPQLLQLFLLNLVKYSQCSLLCHFEVDRLKLESCDHWAPHHSDVKQFGTWGCK